MNFYLTLYTSWTTPLVQLITVDVNKVMFYKILFNMQQNELRGENMYKFDVFSFNFRFKGWIYCYNYV